MMVLMFGWEFPPHITGGLGTACFGLTESLANESVKLTFVVPKLLRPSATSRYNLISASEVELPVPGSQPIPIVKTVNRTRMEKRVLPGNVRIKKQKQSSHLTTVMVDSPLTPYTSPSSREHGWTLEKWNYVFDQEPPKIIRYPKNYTEEEVEFQRDVYTYSFEGGYGSSLMKEVKQYAVVAEELARSQPHDVIHAHDWMTYPAAVAASRASRKPLIVHVHATEFDRTGNCGGAVYDIEMEGLKAAHRIVAVSQWTKDVLINHYQVSGDRVDVVHNGVLPEDTRKKKQAGTIDGPVVTFLGRITYQKGPRYFIEAARKVAERFPEARFIVAGSGDLLPQTIERVAQLRLSNRFHFTGFLTKEWIEKIWSMSNVYVMPSVSEPFGITPLEAIQAGVPVIVSHQSGVAEVMQHALKVNFWDTDALAESICSVLKYQSLSSMLRKEGEGEVKNISWSNAAKKIKRIYEQVAS